MPRRYPADIHLHRLPRETRHPQLRNQRLAEIQNSLAGLVRSVVVVPYDRTLDDGGEIIWEALAPRTRAAYLQATAAVVEGM